MSVKKIDRIGEKNFNNKGFLMTIINYINNNNIDIQFEDGTIVYNKKYCHFKNGKIKHPLYDNNGCLITNNDKNSMDGISIPEKFMLSILKQLNIDYIYQLTNKNFKWCGYFKYDFYLPKYNIIIETHGGQHYDNKRGWEELDKTKMNDLFKYKCAKNHVDNYIIIDCRYSKFNWLKNNVIKELNEYFDLSNINWELAWEESQNSLCVETWELWNKGLCISDIENKLKISKNTILIYLNRGNELNRCNYNISESRKRGRCKVKGRYNCNATPIICLTTKRIFYTACEGAEYYNIKSSANISKCCTRERKSCGKLSDGTPLVWRYIIWRHDKKYRIL